MNYAIVASVIALLALPALVPLSSRLHATFAYIACEWDGPAACVVSNDIK